MTHGVLHDDFRHEALFYSGWDEFVDGTSSFVREGLEADEATLVVLSAPKIEALRSELSSLADRVHFADMGQVGSNPARIIPAWREFVSENQGRRLRGIGEPIDTDRSEAALVECQRHESLLNLAFADTPAFYLMCPYDAEALRPDVLEEARRSHPHLAGGVDELLSSDYRGLEAVAAPYGEPLPAPAAPPDWRVFQRCTLAAMRYFVSDQAANAGLNADDVDDLALAVNEVATNSVVHGGGAGIVRIWQEPEALICEVIDKGPILDPLIGRQQPATDQPGGYGVWMANQLCDLVQIRNFGDRSVVRMHKRRT